MCVGVEATPEKWYRIAREMQRRASRNQRILRNAWCRYIEGSWAFNTWNWKIVWKFNIGLQDYNYKVYIILKDIDMNKFCKSSIESRGHSEKPYQWRSRLDCRHYNFSQRTVGAWNSLEDDDVVAWNTQLTVSNFK